MPELPEVEVVLGQLKASILGAHVQGLAIHRTDIVRQGHEHISWFSNSIITGITRRGKCLIFTCVKSGESRHLLSELGMTGLWLLQPTLAASPQHLHACVTCSSDVAHSLYYWNPRRLGQPLGKNRLAICFRRQINPATFKTSRSISGEGNGLLKWFHILPCPW